tara:strand:- start:4169 stop:5362 length:1194 start_codon:yes stop_codon:yes gene_type:complete
MAGITGLIKGAAGLASAVAGKAGPAIAGYGDYAERRDRTGMLEMDQAMKVRNQFVKETERQANAEGVRIMLQALADPDPETAFQAAIETLPQGMSPEVKARFGPMLQAVRDRKAADERGRAANKSRETVAGIQATSRQAVAAANAKPSPYEIGQMQTRGYQFNDATGKFEMMSPEKQRRFTTLKDVRKSRSDLRKDYIDFHYKEDRLGNTVARFKDPKTGEDILPDIEEWIRNEQYIEDQMGRDEDRHKSGHQLMPDEIPSAPPPGMMPSGQTGPGLDILDPSRVPAAPAITGADTLAAPAPQAAPAGAPGQAVPVAPDTTGQTLGEGAAPPPPPVTGKRMEDMTPGEMAAVDPAMFMRIVMRKAATSGKAPEEILALYGLDEQTIAILMQHVQVEQ